MARPGTTSPMNRAIDFIPLSMTELRNRPGEILERVALQAECFVIERHGHRKACLVPLSVFLPDVSPTRVIQEIVNLEQTGESPRTTVTTEKEIAFKVQYNSKDNSYQIMVVLPHGYPNVCPRVYADPIDSDAPHLFLDGALCIFGVMTSWNPGKHSASHAIKHARHWLNHYDVWRVTGQWPKPGMTDGAESKTL